ncbi:MAG: hypothetical protein ACPGYV_03405 [Phycisphaeraceae bacterium]
MTSLRTCCCAALGLMIAIAAMTGCSVVDDATGVNNANVGQSLNRGDRALTRKELSLRLRRLAMSYLGDVPEVCEAIAASELPLEQRLLALRIRANSSDSVISIAADPDPQVALLNMVTVLTLHRILAEQRGEEFFGELGMKYIDATRRMEAEGWKLAVLVLDAEELKQLRELIVQYREDNPEEVYVWWVRFSEFSGYKERFSIASLGRGVVDLFVPVGDAVAGIETTTDVAERATWLAARQSLIVQWRVELMYLQTLSAPETVTLLDNLERVSDTIDALPGHLAKEREAILQAVDDQQAALNKLMTRAQGILGEVNKTAEQADKIVQSVDSVVKNADQTVSGVRETIKEAEASLANAKELLPDTKSTLEQLDVTTKTIDQTIQTLDAFVRQFETEDDEADEPGRPFDITEYTAAAEQAGKTVTELNALISNLDRTADPSRLDQTLGSVKGQVSALIWQGGFVLLGVGLVLILAAKLMPKRAA